MHAKQDIYITSSQGTLRKKDPKEYKSQRMGEKCCEMLFSRQSWTYSSNPKQASIETFANLVAYVQSTYHLPDAVVETEME